MIGTDSVTNLLNNAQPSRSAIPNNQLDKDAFLKLLTAQLRNQDPLNPTDQESFIQQVATFSNLEQQITTNENMARLLEFQAVSQAASLIGKEVTGLSNGEIVSGTVREVIFVSGIPVMMLEDGSELPHGGLISIGPRPTPPAAPGETPPPADSPEEPPA